MGNIGDSMSSFPIPIVGSSGTTYASQIDAFLNEVMTRLTQKVPLSSIAPGQLDFVNNPAINLQYLGLYPAPGAPTTPVGSLWMYNGNLYFVGSSGAVQITTGTSLNAAALGGITGDYGGSNPAQLRFVNADNRYYFYQDYGNNRWSAALAQFFDLSAVATGANPTYIRLSAAGAASTYTLTLPTTTASTQSVVQMSGGQLSASNTLANAITAPNYHYTSGITYCVSAAMADPGSNSPSRVNTAGTVGWYLTGYNITYPLPGLLTGDVITSYTLYANKASRSPVYGGYQMASYIIIYNPSTGQYTFGGPGAVNSGDSPGIIQLTETSLSVTVGPTAIPSIIATSTNNAGIDSVYSLSYTVTR